MTCQPSQNRIIDPLVWSCIGLLLLAAGGKLWTATTHLRLLDSADPILVVKNMYVLLGVAGIELICAIALLISHHPQFKGLVLLWLGANFGLYRAALLLSGAGTPCPCLGGLGARLGLNSSETELLTKAAVVYLLTVGGYLLFRRTAHLGTKESVPGLAVPSV